jgi:DNA replication protein DnaC
MAALYEPTMLRAETEGWSHRQVLEHLCQSEADERDQRRTARLLAESGLPEGKTLGNLEETRLPIKIRRNYSGRPPQLFLSEKSSYFPLDSC